MIPPYASRIGAILLALTSSSLAEAQAQRRSTPNDTLKSTEVADDHKVTFRIYAPKADEVSVCGDFGQGGKMDEGRPGRLVAHRRPARRPTSTATRSPSTASAPSTRRTR